VVHFEKVKVVGGEIRGGEEGEEGKGMGQRWKETRQKNLG
jgi:hypothetical protein